MNEDAKKTALRMIPYGLYVLTAKGSDGQVAAATINWVTQVSFKPALIAIGVKADSGAHAIIEATREFVLNCLGKDGKGAAFAFFKPTVVEGNKLSGEPFSDGAVVKAPVLDNCPAHVECKVTDVIKRGDHTVFVAEVVEARVKSEPAGRADDAILWMKDLGEKVFYGG
jgi:flavin reductase (DIM6/NTAB) family NADH-FMN oxidoreductase RutF